MPQQVLEIKERSLVENESSDENRPHQPRAQVSQRAFFHKTPQRLSIRQGFGITSHITADDYEQWQLKCPTDLKQQTIRILRHAAGYCMLKHDKEHREASDNVYGVIPVGHIDNIYRALSNSPFGYYVMYVVHCYNGEMFRLFL